MGRTVLLTFDYELFFIGGTVRRCLIEPVDAILRTLEEAGGAKATFFVDATHLLRLVEEPRATGDASAVREQVGRLVAAGHRVELHVHPQWLDAVWAGDGTWEFPVLRSNVLGELEEDRVADLMASGAEVLLEAARAATAGYRLEAFRAPGLCAEPFAPIAAALDALGISIDSSVAPGLTRSTEFHSIDYTGVPDAPAWRFEADPLADAPAGRFAELPISTATSRLSWKLLRRADRTLRPRRYEVWGDGTWMPTGEGLGSKLASSAFCVTLEATPPALLARVLAGAGDVVTTISHPKAMSPGSLESIRWLADGGWDFALPAEVVARTAAPPADR